MYHVNEESLKLLFSFEEIKDQANELNYYSGLIRKLKFQS